MDEDDLDNEQLRYQEIDRLNDIVINSDLTAEQIRALSSVVYLLLEQPPDAVSLRLIVSWRDEHDFDINQHYCDHALSELAVVRNHFELPYVPPPVIKSGDVLSEQGKQLVIDLVKTFAAEGFSAAQIEKFRESIPLSCDPDTYLSSLKWFMARIQERESAQYENTLPEDIKYGLELDGPDAATLYTVADQQSVDGLLDYFQHISEAECSYLHDALGAARDRKVEVRLRFVDYTDVCSPSVQPKDTGWLFSHKAEYRRQDSRKKGRSVMSVIAVELETAAIPSPPEASSNTMMSFRERAVPIEELRRIPTEEDAMRIEKGLSKRKV